MWVTKKPLGIRTSRAENSDFPHLTLALKDSCDHKWPEFDFECPKLANFNLYCTIWMYLVNSGISDQITCFYEVWLMCPCKFFEHTWSAINHLSVNTVCAKWFFNFGFWKHKLELDEQFFLEKWYLLTVFRYIIEIFVGQHLGGPKNWTTISEALLKIFQGLVRPF